MLPCPPDGQSGRAVYLGLAASVPASTTTRPDTTGTKPGGWLMQLEILRSIDTKDAPTLAPDDRPIDLVHLARTTLGDRGLEREVLQLFDRQSTLLIARMRSAAPAGIATLAHTLKGSARGIGAWRVARAAEALERAGSCGPDAVQEALDRLAAAADEARAVIAELLLPN